MPGDVPDRLRFLLSHLLHLVLTVICIVGEVANIGDVDDVGEFVTLPTQRPPEDVGKDIGAHIADMRVIVDRRPARIDPRLALMERLECFDFAGERIEQA